MPNILETKPRVALIGVTGYGTIYLNLVRDALASDAIDLVAAVIINRDTVPEIVAELIECGATIYAGTDEFFAEQSGKVDLCLIPVGIQWHARLTVSALRAGMNVLVEKPLAGSVRDVDAIRVAEKETGRWVAVGFQDLYSVETHWIKTLICDEVIGRLESVRMIGMWPRSRAYFSRNHWAGRLEADGAVVLDSPLNNAFAHFVNLALFFAGRGQHTSSSARVVSAELYRAHDIESFDTALVRAATAQGVDLTFCVSHSSGVNREPEIYIQGSRGRIEWWHEQRCIIIDSSDRRQVFPLHDSNDSRQRMMQAVLDKLTDRSTFVCTTDIARNHTLLIEAVHDAAKVETFPPESVEWVAEEAGGPETPHVRDLSVAMENAINRNTPLLKDVVSANNQLAPR